MASKAKKVKITFFRLESVIPMKYHFPLAPEAKKGKILSNKR